MVFDPLDDSKNTQFELSYELLHFLGWLLHAEQDHKTLKALIQKSFKAGCKKAYIQEEMQGLQYNILEFFSLLDSLLHETMHENTFQKVKQKKLIQTIQKIDGALYDDNTLEKTTHELERSPEKNPKSVLCETLLKQWRPGKGTDFN